MTYYVYELIDPRDNKPFYVGKGKGARIDSHEKSQENSKKSARLKEIRDAGLKVRKSFLKEFKDEDAAYRFEARRIKQIGLKNLTNIAPGGRAPGYSQDPMLSEDKTRLDVFASFASKTAGFKSKAVFTYCGKRIELPDTFIPALYKRVQEVMDRRGEEWVGARLLSRGIKLVFSKVDYAAP